MDMILAGKTGPEEKNIINLSANGFTHMELYLETRHLKNMEITKENITSAKNQLNSINKDIKIISIHIPHLRPDETDSLENIIELSKEHDAIVVFHSKNMTLEETIAASKPLDDELGNNLTIENKHTMNLSSIVGQIIPYNNLTLDIAHLYRASQNVYQDLELLLKNYKEKIKLMHINDSTKEKDGLAIGEGDINFHTIMSIISNENYHNPIIIETEENKQLESKNIIENILKK